MASLGRVLAGVGLIVATATPAWPYSRSSAVADTAGTVAAAELDSPFLWARSSARARLTADGDARVCLALLDREDHRIREAAMAALAAWLVASRPTEQDPEGSDPGTGTASPDNRESASAPGSASPERSEIFDRALQSLDREPDPATRWAMAQSLARLEDEALVRAAGFGSNLRALLLRALVRAELEALLGQITSLRGSIKGFFRDPFDEVLAYDAAVPSVLLEIAADPALSESLRGLAVRALGETDDPSLVEALRPVLARQRTIVDEREAEEAFPIGLDGQLYRALRYVLYRLGDRQPFFSRITDLKLRGLRALQTRRKQMYYFEYEWEVAYEWHQVKEYEMANDRYLGLIRQLEAYELTIPSITRISYYNLACIASIRGELDAAHEYLDEAISLGFNDLDWILIDRDLEALRADARFEDIRDRLTD